MKKIFKIICILLIIIISAFLIFIIEESIRLRNHPGAMPLVLTDQTKYCVSCMKIGEETEIEYYSIGYKLKVRCTLSEDSTEEDKTIIITGQEFMLFNKFKLWAWIS